MSVFTRPTEEQQLELSIQRKLNNLNVCKPCRVVAVGVNTVDVQVLDKLRIISQGTEVSYIDMPVIHDVPVMNYHVQTKGFSITLPISVGDTGLLMFCDKDITGFMNGSGSTNIPSSEGVGKSIRQHSLQDAVYFAVLDNNSNKISSISTDCVEIRNSDASTHMKLYSDKIDIAVNSADINVVDSAINISKASSKVVVEDASVSVQSGGTSVVVSSSGGVECSGSGASMSLSGGSMTVKGNLVVSGNITCSSNISATGTVHGSNI